jgi:hypothetical protein
VQSGPAKRFQEVSVEDWQISRDTPKGLQAISSSGLDIDDVSSHGASAEWDADDGSDAYPTGLSGGVREPSVD